MRPVIRGAFVASLFVFAMGLAAQQSDFEGTTHGFPALRDSAGKKLADGDFAQWLENDRLHVRIRYDFGGGHSVEETGVFHQTPRLIQDEWSLRELKNKRVHRDFAVHFGSRTATAKKLEENELKQWSDTMEIEPGRTFAGFGFTLAIKSLRARLIKGEHIELRAIGFTPKPRAVSVEVSHAGRDEMEMGGRAVRGDRFVVHPKIPWIAELFVNVPDIHIWLTIPPAGFLRFEGPLAEPKDPVIRVDVLPGGRSSRATAVGSRARQP